MFIHFTDYNVHFISIFLNCCTDVLSFMHNKYINKYMNKYLAMNQGEII